MNLREIAEMAGLNYPGVQKTFPHLVGRELSDKEFNEVLNHYLHSSRVSREKKDALRKMTRVQPKINWVYMACVVLLISIQAWHFMHIAIDAAVAAGRQPIFWIDYLMGFLFESAGASESLNPKPKCMHACISAYTQTHIRTNTHT